MGTRSETIKLLDARNMVKHVRENIQNDARAHILEDGAYLIILTALADGKLRNPRACAKEVIKIAEIKFERWYE